MISSVSSTVAGTKSGKGVTGPSNKTSPQATAVFVKVPHCAVVASMMSLKELSVPRALPIMTSAGAEGHITVLPLTVRGNVPVERLLDKF